MGFNFLIISIISLKNLKKFENFSGKPKKFCFEKQNKKINLNVSNYSFKRENIKM